MDQKERSRYCPQVSELDFVLLLLILGTSTFHYYPTTTTTTLHLPTPPQERLRLNLAAGQIMEFGPVERVRGQLSHQDLTSFPQVMGNNHSNYDSQS
jgi:hypothetical protein